MILVTGASGFVGRHVLRRLATRGDAVRAMARDPARLEPGSTGNVVIADLLQPDTLPPALAGVTTVVHAAAITANFKEPFRGAYDAINREGTERLVAAANEAGVRTVVLVSGLGTVPGRPGSYMATRWGMEEAVRNSGMAYAIVRPSVQFGEDAEFIAALVRLIRRSPVVPAITARFNRFQPIWVEDVVTCVLACVDDPRLHGAEHTIGGSEYHTFRGVLEVILEAMGKRRVIAPLPVGIARIQARLMQVLPRPPLTAATMELFSLENTTDLDAVDRTFGFHPRGLREHLMAHGVAS